MTTYALDLSLEDVCIRAAITLEGRILHCYDGLIPGVSPPLRGTHYFFDKDVQIVHCNNKWTETTKSALKAVGFWTTYGDRDIQIGEVLRVSLDRHLNNDGFLTLMPAPISQYNVVRVSDGTPVSEMFVSPDILRGRKSSDDLLYEWFTSVFSSQGWGDAEEFGNVAAIWRQANANLDFFFNGCMIGPCPHVGDLYHNVYWRDSLPPVAGPRTEDDCNGQPLATTEGRGTNGTILFNACYPWHGGTSAPPPDKYDMLTVAAHEMGHGLGIGHLNSSSLNVMYHTTTIGVARRTLQAPDIDALTNIYGLHPPSDSSHQ